MSVVLSIIIPTKTRPRTAVAAVRSALAVSGADVEVVVQDCGTAGLGARLSTLTNDERLRYEHDPSRRSMADNWNAALARVRGDYVCIVGDDDAVMPELRDVALWARANAYPAVAFPHGAYWWADFPGPRAGSLLLGHHRSRVTSLEGSRELEAALTPRGVALGRLPQLYHGLLRYDVLRQRYREHGVFVETLAPDYDAAVAAATRIGNYAFVDYPLTVCGYSASSNSGRIARKSLGNHLAEYDLDWPALLPPLDRGSIGSDLVVAEAVLRSLQRNGRADLVSRFPFAASYAASLLARPRSTSEWAQHFVRASRARNAPVAREAVRVGWQALQLARRNARVSIAHRLPGLLLQHLGYDLLPVSSLSEAVESQRRAQAVRAAPLRLAV